MRNFALALSLGLLWVSPALGAQAPGDDATARAKEAFAAGQQLYKAGRYAEAVARFEAAYAAKPHPSIFFNIAKSWEQLDEVAKALRAFKDYLRADPDAQDKQSVEDSIANLERKLRGKGLQQILIFALPKDATITVNGKMLGTSPASTELPAGTHTLAVRASGYTAVERTFSMQLAKGSELTVVLEKAAVAASTPSDAPVNGPALAPEASTQTEAAVAPAPRRRLFTFVAGGLALAGLGTGIALGVVSANASATLHAEPHPQAEATALVNTATSTAIGANVAYGVAGAAAITAVILFIVEGKPAAPIAGGGTDAR
jgi:tetratricopeptide (TPR) repeat protein